MVNKKLTGNIEYKRTICGMVLYVEEEIEPMRYYPPMDPRFRKRVWRKATQTDIFRLRIRTKPKG